LGKGTSNNNLNLKKKDLIKYKWIYSNEEDSFGIILKKQNELNFGVILKILKNDGTIEEVPQRMIKIEKIQDEYKNINLQQ
tara:strand:- start:297 stop:539 length:243 start_codon:yes stop_codon:yes gene_type:complete